MAQKSIAKRGTVRQTCQKPILTVLGSECVATWANYSSLSTHTRTDEGAITQFRDKEEEVIGLHPPSLNDGLTSRSA